MQEKEYYLKIDNLYNRALLLVSDLFQDKKYKRRGYDVCLARLPKR